MKTYDKMNKEIVGILRQSNNPTQLYAARRIEELEGKAKRIKNIRLFIVETNREICVHPLAILWLIFAPIFIAYILISMFFCGKGFSLNDDADMEKLSRKTWGIR